MSTRQKKKILAILLVCIFAIIWRISAPERFNAPQEQPGHVPTQASEPVSTASGTIQPDQRTPASVIRIIDGDTVEVMLGGNEEAIRVIGINTPETVDPRRPVECFGKEASVKAQELLMGQSVLLESDDSQSNRDRYNRLLRFVFMPDGTDYGKYMIENGFAYEYTYDTPYRYQAEYKSAQQKAQEEKRGLWSEEDPCEQQSSIL